MRITFLAFIFLLLTNMSFAQNQETEAKIESLLAKMTLQEKIGQMNQYTGFFDPTGPVPDGGDAEVKFKQIEAGLVGSMLNVKGVKEVRAMQKIAVENTRLGIPLIFAFDVIHGYKTASPIPLAEAASWDLAAIQESARVAAKEAAAAGLNWTFAPMVDISRDARWGRVMEGAGEDTYLGSKIATARVNGFQGKDLGNPYTLAACAKHFAAYGFSEAGKDYNTADIGLSTLYNVVLPPFKATVDANISTFMNSFNDLNGIPASADKFLQREILKGKWNYDGVVVSDWGSYGEMVNHRYARDKKHAAELALNGGSDIDMESKAYVVHLEELVKEGKVKEAQIDDAVRRILRLKHDMGLFEDPYKYCDEKREKEVTGSEEIVKACLDMARKSIVLMKNEKNLLPIAKSGKKIAVIGSLANDKNSPIGNWRMAVDDNTAVSVMEGLAKYDGNEIKYTKGVELLKDNKTSFPFELKVNLDDRSEFEAAIENAKTADVVVMVLGEHGLHSGEARSRANIDLPGLQQELLEKVYAVNKNIVLVLFTGRPIAMPWAAENIPAIINGWQLGSQTGHAIAEVLFGDHNPGGKLPMTFPRSVAQVPIYYNYKSTGRPSAEGGMIFYQHYMDMTNEPQFVFGHGLSYTTFKYTDLKVMPNVSPNSTKVAVTVTNSGKVTGTEVVQLYIQDRFASITRPIKELKGFEKIELAPGASKTVEFMLTGKELGFFNNKGEFIVEPGMFDVMVGGSSKTVLADAFELK